MKSPSAGRRIVRKPQTGSAAYRQAWRVIDGAVVDCMACHPDYFTVKGARLARNSIVKRAVGALLGYAKQSQRGDAR